MGFPHADTQLRSLGVIAEAVPFPEDEPVIHTTNEAVATVRYSQDIGVESLLVVAPPFHLPRAVLAHLTAAKATYPKLRVYAKQAAPDEWNEVVRHSQGKVRATREDLIDAELQRIQAYIAKGDLIPLNDALVMMKTRDSRP